MDLDSLIAAAAANGASDLHLEAGMPAAVRVRGALQVTGEPIAPRTLADIARRVIGEEQWPVFLERRSYDLSKTIQGVRCRLNVLQTARGVGLAIRLLAPFQATVEKLNLHPDLKKLVKNTHGLILVSGPTGCGKSSTLAALIQEINLTETRHVVTVESPIEYAFRPRRAYIRQREVGRDTPSFEQALLDALREDPDVLMVGEMRDPETMRLTLSASETGHLVVATVHSATCAEALQRVASAFSPEIQGAVCAQLADCLVAVISQRLRFRPDLNIRVPECEILVATHAVKNFIRTREFFKIISAIETGADHGMWSFQRYAKWLDTRTNFYVPGRDAEPPDSEPAETSPADAPLPPIAAAPKIEKKGGTTKPSAGTPAGRRIEIEPVEGGFGKILKKPES
ncbi:MAG TPA: PilT/PilU family type 4a pilus ATPase [Candidatus Acidoferrum sp.]|nr:PilT/PilU family type 4a pilus ATPase [Candidatus Acidoferrum sp.]